MDRTEQCTSVPPPTGPAPHVSDRSISSTPPVGNPGALQPHQENSPSPQRGTSLFVILCTLFFTFCLHLKWKLNLLGFIHTDLIGEFSSFLRLCLMERHNWNCQESIDVAFTHCEKDWQNHRCNLLV